MNIRGDLVRVKGGSLNNIRTETLTINIDGADTVVISSTTLKAGDCRRSTMDFHIIIRGQDIGEVLIKSNVKAVAVGISIHLPVGGEAIGSNISGREGDRSVWCRDINHTSDSINTTENTLGIGGAISAGENKIKRFDELGAIYSDGGGLEVRLVGFGAGATIGTTTKLAPLDAAEFIDPADRSLVKPVVDAIIGDISSAISIINLDFKISIVPLAWAAGSGEDVELLIDANGVKIDCSLRVGLIKANGVFAGVGGGTGPVEAIRHAVDSHGASIAKAFIFGGITSGKEGGPIVETTGLDDILPILTNTPNRIAIERGIGNS